MEEAATSLGSADLNKLNEMYMYPECVDRVEGDADERPRLCISHPYRAGRQAAGRQRAGRVGRVGRAGRVDESCDELYKLPRGQPLD